MQTQTDGVLISDWGKFANDSLKLYLGNKVAQEISSDAIVPESDTKIVSASQTPPAIPGATLGFLKSPMGIAVAVGAVLVLFWVVKKF